MRKFTLFIMLATVCTVSACLTHPDEQLPDAPLYISYRFWGDEESGQVHGLIKFKQRQGVVKAIGLEEPAKVMLDNQLLQPDSTPFTGVYYEVEQPLRQFKGPHTITFTAGNGKQYKESFTYDPFTISNELPETIGRQDLIINLQGLQPGDSVRVLLIDTSFTSRGINEVRAVTNDTIQISKQQLSSLANGPITLQLIKEAGRPLKKQPKNGGHISLSYTITRELELRDRATP